MSGWKVITGSKKGTGNRKASTKEEIRPSEPPSARGKAQKVKEQSSAKTIRKSALAAQEILSEVPAVQQLVASIIDKLLVAAAAQLVRATHSLSSINFIVAPYAFGIGSLATHSTETLLGLGGGGLPIEVAQLGLWLAVLDGVRAELKKRRIRQKKKNEQKRDEEGKQDVAAPDPEPIQETHFELSLPQGLGYCFDPANQQQDVAAFKSLGIQCLEENTLGTISKHLDGILSSKNKAGHRPTNGLQCNVALPLVFLPHCPKQLCNNLVSDLLNYNAVHQRYQKSCSSLSYIAPHLTILCDDFRFIYQKRCTPSEREQLQGLSFLASSRDTVVEAIRLTGETGKKKKKQKSAAAPAGGGESNMMADSSQNSSVLLEEHFVANSFVDINLITTTTMIDAVVASTVEDEDGATVLLPMVQFT